MTSDYLGQGSLTSRKERHQEERVHVVFREENKQRRILPLFSKSGTYFSNSAHTGIDYHVDDYIRQITTYKEGVLGSLAR